MKTTLLRAGALSCALLASTALVTPAQAQSTPPPRFNEVDRNGVDLVSGDFFFSMVEGSIGSGEGQLSLVRNWAGDAGWRDNWSGSMYGIGSLMVVEFGTYSDTFTISVDPVVAFASTKGDGATLEYLTGGDFRYRSRDGTTIIFRSRDPSHGEATFQGPACPFDGGCSIPIQIQRPNGMTYNLDWDIEFRVDVNGWRAYPRFRGVTNSANYSFTVNYVTDTPGSAAPVADWYVRDGAQFTNLDGAPASPPTVSYARPSAGVTEVTDIGGHVWRLTETSGALSGIRRPGANSDTTTISYSSGQVSSVTNQGVATAYAFSTSGSTGTATVTDANSQVTTVISDLTKGRVTSVTDPLTRTTSFEYDSNSRLTRVTRDEGNSIGYTYDARGNMTEMRLREKDDNGDAGDDIVTSASYDSTCSNVVTCNQPNSVTDARGYRTDYTYNGTHGGVETVTRPAPSGSAPVGSGDRPQTRYSYTQVTAVAGEPVYMLTGVSACASGTVASNCVGTASESRQVIAYDSDNLRTTSVTARDGTGGISATSAFTYDAVGNLLTVDGPLPGTADTTRYRYDAARQIVGVIGPDPDGGGSLKHRAVRMTYTNGLPTSVEQGNVNSQSDSDWTSGFTSLQRVEQDYDTNARPTVQRLMSGSTTYQLTQTSYDSLGRVRCVAQRMNSAEFGSLPSDACTLDTQGSFGADRITRTSYDNAGQVTRVETGVGVSGVAADEVTVNYTDNGLPQIVTDANGNSTYLNYDGFDRQNYRVMPHPTSTGSWNWADYDYFGYDATGRLTGTQRRDGTRIFYSYDNLGRLTGVDTPPEGSGAGSYGEYDRTYTHDLLSRVTQYGAASGLAVNAQYDALGRQTSEASFLATKAMGYDAAGRLTRLTWMSDGLSIAYDRLVTGEVSAIRENPDGANVSLATYAYDDAGRRSSLTRGNGAVTSYGYDAVSRLNQLVQNLNGTGSDLTLDFTHNPAGEIATNTRSNDAYSYTSHANANVTNTVNGLNQVTNTGGTSVSHDGRGNVSAIGSNSYAYTIENFLSQAPSALIVPDARMRPAQVTNTSTSTAVRFDYIGDQLIAEYDSSNALLRRFVPGPDLDEPLVWYEGSGISTGRWFHADERGSVIAVSDASGNLLGSNPNRYDEYGVPQGTLTGRFGYTGQAWIPEAGLYHYRARAYHPGMGRFMQTDPIGYGGGMNLYAYVGNNPVNFTDPFGLQDDPNECGGYPCPVVTGDRGFQSAAWIRSSSGGHSPHLITAGGGGQQICSSCHDPRPNPWPPLWPSPREPRRPRPAPTPPPPPPPPVSRDDRLICRIADSFVVTGEVAATAGTVALATPAAVSGAGVAAGGAVSIGVGSLIKRIAGC